MARKSIKGYAEKNYYDNTKFNGGIVATNDPLNEGYFKHLVNFDISDMGQSLTPRKGYLTTTLKGSYTNEEKSIETQVLNKQTIYFYDEALGEYIFLDLGNSGTDSSKRPAWRVKFDIEGNFITSCTHIANVEYKEIKDVVNFTDAWVLKRINPINTNQALRIVDENLVTSYIIKVWYDDVKDGVSAKTYFWLKLFYRKNKTKYGNNEYDEDTLVLTYLDTEDIVNYVNPINKNIASSKSLIPLDMQEVYTDENKPTGFIQEFPMIYVKTSKGDYLINTCNSLDGLTIIPNFYINEPPENFNWYYTYDVTRMNYAGNLYLDDYAVYESPVFSLKTNEVLKSENLNIIGVYEESRNEVFSNYFNTITTGSNETKFKNLSDFVYIDLIDSITKPETQKASYIIYLVPKTSTDVRTDFYIDEDTLDIGGVSSFFQNNRVVMKTENGEYIYPLQDQYTHNERYQTSLKHCSEVDQRIITTINDVHNSNYYVFSPKFCTIINSSIHNSTLKSLKSITNQTLLSTLESLESTYDFYIRDYRSLKPYNNPDSNNLGFDRIYQTALDSPIIAFCNEYEDSNLNPKSANEIYDTLKKKDVHLLFNVMQTSTEVEWYSKDSEEYINSNISKFLPHITNTSKISYKYKICCSFYFQDILTSKDLLIPEPIPGSSVLSYASLLKYNILNLDNNPFNGHHSYMFNRLFKPYIYTDKWVDTEIQSFNTTLNPMINPFYNETSIIDILISPVPDLSMFTIEEDNTILASLNDSNTTYKSLSDLNYFDTGINLTLYLMLVPTKEYISENKDLFKDFVYDRNYLKISTNLRNSKLLNKIQDVPSVYPDPDLSIVDDIKLSNNYLVFNSLLGDHLVVYAGNKVYISKEGIPYYFTQDYMKEYPEPVVKVIQYKDMLLVFTTQNLYALYFYEDTETVENGVDDEGNPQTVQQKVLKFATLPVLYNLLVNEKYKDAIQVYNQMVLFYSADGQMFLIKPTAAIDSNTRFSIQYFNKSANDILLNYKEYIQERLVRYNIDTEIEDIDIKVSATINYIKVFYNAYYTNDENKKEYIITYVLVYDVLNNRYYSYDTLAFTKINSINYTSDNEMYITEHDDNLYFTIPYVSPNSIDNNVDISYYDNFSPYPINTELDTGTINLNNHLKKRFKDLHVIYKNLNANNLEFKLDTFVDDIPIITYINSELDIKDVSGYNTLTVTDTNNVVQLIENTALFNFLDYTSNKIITHKSNIISRGKTIRIKMNFSSKGKYKIQGYGLIYKEHTV